jgi:hypothetical protein
MPTNKGAKFRFDIIDECLRNKKKKWSKAELLKFVNRRLELHYGDEKSISISQLRYDLLHMETEFAAPIRMYREGKNYYYEYEDPNFSIRNIIVNDEDIEMIKEVIHTLQDADVQYLADDMKELLNKLNANENTTDENKKEGE